MKSIKQFLIAGMLAMSTFANAQVNTPGTIYAGGGIGLFIGGGTFEEKGSGFSKKFGAVSVGFNLGLKAQYAFASKFSAGIYVETGATGYASVDEEEDWNSTGSRQLMFGVEAKYFMLNKSKLALTIGPQVGLMKSKDEIELEYSSNSETYDGTSSGICYGFNFGLNFFWSQHLGMFVDVGFNGSSLKGDLDISSIADYQLSNFGVAAGVGILAKFGGTPKTRNEQQ
jgi:hypothetical protein